MSDLASDLRLALRALRRNSGLAVALALSRALAGLLFGVTATDPLTYAGVAGLISGVAFLASWLPARKATSIDPVIALRSE
ncbi:MAG: hypothetical protein HYS34_07105 [Acidobacteria bacterium]|nr:hypothetical protein [Acidobacteriota bacterium]